MENMISVPMKARVDVPLEGEISRSLPDQMGNVAGAHSDELHQRLSRPAGAWTRWVRSRRSTSSGCRA